MNDGGTISADARISLNRALARDVGDDTDAGQKGQRYDAATYVGAPRCFSYAHQLSAVISLASQDVLEIGVGNRVTCESLRLLGIGVTTLDIDSRLGPDIVASVTQIPAADRAFDTAVCCQVLEHLPFQQFTVALEELRRVTSRALVLSLPDVSRYVEFTCHLPRLGRRTFAWSPSALVPRACPPARVTQMGHYWEIGFRGFSLRTVKMEIRRAGWAIARTWRVPEQTWHRFFLLTAS